MSLLKPIAWKCLQSKWVELLQDSLIFDKLLTKDRFQISHRLSCLGLISSASCSMISLKIAWNLTPDDIFKLLYSSRILIRGKKLQMRSSCKSCQSCGWVLSDSWEPLTTLSISGKPIKKDSSSVWGVTTHKSHRVLELIFRIQLWHSQLATSTSTKAACLYSF